MLTTVQHLIGLFYLTNSDLTTPLRSYPVGIEFCVNYFARVAQSTRASRPSRPTTGSTRCRRALCRRRPASPASCPAWVWPPAAQYHLACPSFLPPSLQCLPWRPPPAPRRPFRRPPPALRPPLPRRSRTASTAFPARRRWLPMEPRKNLACSSQFNNDAPCLFSYHPPLCLEKLAGYCFLIDLLNIDFFSSVLVVFFVYRCLLFS